MLENLKLFLLQNQSSMAILIFTHFDFTPRCQVPTFVHVFNVLSNNRYTVSAGIIQISSIKCLCGSWQTPSSVKKTLPTVTGTNGVDLPVTLHFRQPECINCDKSPL